jgi:signal transduction histidine kinase
VLARPQYAPKVRLAHLLWLDVATCATAVAVLLVVHLFVYDSVYVLVLATMVAAAGVVMALGSIPLRAGRSEAAVAYVAVANYVIAVLTTAIATFAMPILLVATLLPTVLAVPYVSGRHLRWYVAGSFVSALAVAMLGSLQDVTGFSDDLPSWVPPAVVVGFTPFVAGMVAFVAVTNANALRDSLADALRTNAQLAAAQEALSANTEALRASRARVVAAGDRERRRIERDLHDGVQQRLTGVAVRLAITQERISDAAPAAAEEIGTLRTELREAVVELRDLAHGVYPPALTQRGLKPAVRSVLARFPLPVTADLRASDRYPAEAENAVYFCCLEALQNVLKHAPSASTVTVLLCEVGSVLQFEVRDDGPGFDQRDRVEGIGFDNMADRLGAAGGRLVVTSAPGTGTSVGGFVPVGIP